MGAGGGGGGEGDRKLDVSLGHFGQNSRKYEAKKVNRKTQSQVCSWFSGTSIKGKASVDLTARRALPFPLDLDF